jgi:general secretion pathway protein M
MNLALLQTWWSQRPNSEKKLLRLALVLVGAALVWSLAVAPALRALRHFDTQHAVQEAQLQHMLRLQAAAKDLQAQPRMNEADAAQALQASVQQVFAGKADMTVSAGVVTVTLRGVSASALAQWLQMARTQAHAMPVQARLSRAGDEWSGSLQIALSTN